MKKILLLLAITFINVCCLAQVRPQIPDISENYDMSEINIDRLAERLKLNDYQTEYLKIVHETMVTEINDGIASHGFIKTRKLDRAIANNIKSMKKVLSNEQFELYRELLTTTIRNNFNMMLYNTFKDMPKPPRFIRRR